MTRLRPIASEKKFSSENPIIAQQDFRIYTFIQNTHPYTHIYVFFHIHFFLYFNKISLFYSHLPTLLCHALVYIIHVPCLSYHNAPIYINDEYIMNDVYVHMHLASVSVDRLKYSEASNIPCPSPSCSFHMYSAVSVCCCRCRLP